LLDRRKAIQKSPDAFIKFLSDCLLNIINGNVRGISKKKLKDHEGQIKKLTTRRTSIKERKVILASPKGLKLLSTTVGPVLKHLSTKWK